VEVVLAVVSAVLFALGTVLQQRAGQVTAEGTHAGLLVRLARRPVWLCGILADALGFVAQAAALGVGRLAVVQPLLTTSVVFALPLGARLSGQRIHRRELGAAVLVVAAIAAFLLVADPAGGRSEAPLHVWILAGVISCAACAPLVALAHRAPAPARRAALLGCAAGVLFALSAALTKAVVDELHAGVGHLALSWPPYALAGVGYVSLTLNQLALDTGALAATIATSTALDPVTGVLLGLGVFHESPRLGAGGAVVTALALAGALGGLVVLARAEGESPPQLRSRSS
jgi:drug/metabolite transporter (DMT)-like permease